MLEPDHQKQSSPFTPGFVYTGATQAFLQQKACLGLKSSSLAHTKSVHGGCFGPLATSPCESRQARKGATVVIDLCAETGLLRPPPYLLMDEVMAHQVLARKWRPKNFQELVGQTQVVTTLSNALNKGLLHHAYLLTGTRGVGKTTIARIMAKALNCEQGISATPCGKCSTCLAIDAGDFMDLYEIDAASRTRVEDTREILDNVLYAPTSGRYKIYLIDEVHMLSGHSFNALLKTLEEPPEHVKFILATTDPQKLPATVLSRCLQFHLLLIPAETCTERLSFILGQEDITFDPAALPLIAKAAKGSMRDALSLLDQAIAFGNGEVTLNTTQNMLGTISTDDLLTLVTSLANQETDQLLSTVANMQSKGIQFSQALNDLIGLLHQLALTQLTEHNHTDLQALAKQLSPQTVQLFYDIATHGLNDMKLAPNPRVSFEMTLLRMLAFEKADETPILQARTTPIKIPTPASSPQPAAKPVVQPTATETTPASTATQVDSSTWHQLVAQMKLGGVTQALAQHCSLERKESNTMHLLLNKKHRPLLSSERSKRIETELSRVLGQAIHIQVNVTGDEQLATPQKQTEQNNAAAHAHAKAALQADPIVQQIMQTFDATLVEESITPKLENNPPA